MKPNGADRVLGVEAALRELVRDVVRDELRSRPFAPKTGHPR
jgi:hypothetical protein